MQQMVKRGVISVQCERPVEKTIVNVTMRVGEVWEVEETSDVNQIATVALLAAWKLDVAATSGEDVFVNICQPKSSARRRNN